MSSVRYYDQFRQFSVSKAGLLKLALFNEKVILDNVIIQLFLTEIAWPKAIPLRCTYCLSNPRNSLNSFSAKKKIVKS
jgi:hypothetical protein